MDFKLYSRSILKGSILSFIITILLTAILSLVMCAVEISSGVYNFIYVIFSLISLVLGCVLATKINGSKGWLVGVSVGIVYYLLVMIMNAILGGGVQFDIIRFLMSLGTGLLAGMLGVNLWN